MKIVGRILIIALFAVLVSWLTTLYTPSSGVGNTNGGRPGFETRGEVTSTERQFPTRSDVGRGRPGLYGAMEMFQPTLIITAIVVFVAPVAQFFRRRRKQRQPRTRTQSIPLTPVPHDSSQ